MHLQVVLNAYAKDVFRYQADCDYVAARMSYRLRLRQQFLWLALQSVEKYLKAILLFNGESSRYRLVDGKKDRYDHDLTKLLAQVNSFQFFESSLAATDVEFLTLLNKHGKAGNRYSETASYNLCEWIHSLDESVWKIRRFCQYIPDRGLGSKNLVPGLKEVYIRSIASEEHLHKPQRFRIIGGELEAILGRKSKDHARRALVWANMWYGSRVRRRVHYSSFSSSQIPPHERGWEGVDWENVKEYVKF